MMNELQPEQIQSNLDHHIRTGDVKQFKKWKRIARLNGFEVSNRGEILNGLPTK